MKSATEKIRELVEWTNAQENRAVNRSSAQALAIYLARKKAEKAAQPKRPDVSGVFHTISEP